MVHGGSFEKMATRNGWELDTAHGYNRGARGRASIKRGMRRRFRHSFDVTTALAFEGE